MCFVKHNVLIMFIWSYDLDFGAMVVRGDGLQLCASLQGSDHAWMTWMDDLGLFSPTGPRHLVTESTINFSL